MRPTIVHVEDDQAVADFVRVVFQRFDFGGRMLEAGTVAEGLALVEHLRNEGEGPDLIITDMELPDGTGLDLLHHIKGNPAMASTPVLVLSSRADPSTVDEAYALGANCYVSKWPSNGTIVESLEAMYRFWMEGVVLPTADGAMTPRTLLSTAQDLRLGVADVYAKLARRFAAEEEFSRFWLNLSLEESNFANLLAFFRERLEDRDLPGEELNRLRDLQAVRMGNLEAVRLSLAACPNPSAEVALEHTARLTEGMGDRTLAKILGLLFPRGPVVARVLTERLIAHWTSLADRFESRPDHPALARSAAELRAHIRTARAAAADYDAVNSSAAG